MHVALYSPAWPFGSAPNGIVTYVDSMRSELISQGHRVSVVSSKVRRACADSDIQPAVAGPLGRLAEGIAVGLFKRPPSVTRYGDAIACHPSPFLKELPADLVQNGDEKAKEPVQVDTGKNLFASMRAALD